MSTTGQNVGGINGPAPLNVGGHGGAPAEGRVNVDGLGRERVERRRDGFDRSIVRVVEQAGSIPNLAYRSMFWDQVRSFTPRYRASLSYVTGAQNMKVGFETYHNRSIRNYLRGNGLQYRFNNGVPNQLTML